MSVPRLATVADLTDGACLGEIVGPIATIERAPLAGGGLSGSSHERITARLLHGSSRDLVLKTVVPSASWTAYRTGDGVGREALVLDEAALQGIWEVAACPYLAHAIEPGQFGLLMDDLTPWLLHPGCRLSIEQENAFLRALASLHARFWESDAIASSWLAPLPVRFSILGPGAGEEELRRHPGHPLFELVARGWQLALARVPPSLRDLLLTPAEEIAARFAGLPATLLHGDVKTGNCAFLSGGEIALFDWATPGPGPATIDLFYYLAVDASRHAGSKDAIVGRYRSYLEVRLGRRVSEGVWRRLEEAGAAAATRMLLWRMALDLERGADGAEQEWRWWLERNLL